MDSTIRNYIRFLNTKVPEIQLLTLMNRLTTSDTALQRYPAKETS
jgi:hypothetical protein